MPIEEVHGQIFQIYYVCVRLNRQSLFVLAYGNWGTWSNYSVCSESCGGGSKSRTRLCDVPPPCTGLATESQACNTENCPGRLMFLFVDWYFLCLTKVEYIRLYRTLIPKEDMARMTQQFASPIL